MKENCRIILGSASPRRKDLLANLGISFDVIVPNILEKRRPSETPANYVLRNSNEKLSAIANGLPQNSEPSIIVCADTIVSLGSRVLEKPADFAEARKMLKSLQNKDHVVITGVAIARIEKNKMTYQKSFVERTKVKIKKLSSKQIDDYIRTGEPYDKAGGYAAQGLGSFMVEKISGSYSNVVGLPVAKVADILTQDLKIEIFRNPLEISQKS